MQERLQIPTVRGHHVSELQSIFRSMGDPMDIDQRIEGLSERLYAFCYDTALGITHDPRPTYVPDVIGAALNNTAAFERYVTATFHRYLYFAKLPPLSLVAIVDIPDLILCSACVIGDHCRADGSKEADQSFLYQNFENSHIHTLQTPPVSVVLVPSFVLKTTRYLMREYALNASQLPNHIQLLTEFLDTPALKRAV